MFLLDNFMRLFNHFSLFILMYGAISSFGSKWSEIFCSFYW